MQQTEDIVTEYQKLIDSYEYVGRELDRIEDANKLCNRVTFMGGVPTLVIGLTMAILDIGPPAVYLTLMGASIGFFSGGSINLWMLRRDLEKLNPILERGRMISDSLLGGSMRDSG